MVILSKINGLSLRDFCGRLEKSSLRQVSLPSLANFFLHNPQNSSQILCLVKFIANFHALREFEFAFRIKNQKKKNTLPKRRKGECQIRRNKKFCLP